LLLGFFALNFMACEGPEGPAGPEGPMGDQGIQGEKGDKGDPGQDGQDGKDGLDGSTKCESCHDVSTAVRARQIQWENSGHATGGTYERNGTDCAMCHTHEGFREYWSTGAIAAPPSNPSPVQCRTCHNIHDTYSPADYGLSYTEAVTFWSGNTYDRGKSNLCSHCHQPRTVEPWPDLNSSDPVTIGTTRYGPHHGPQSALLSGQEGVEIPGSISYPSAKGFAHYSMNQDGCVTCHMAEAFGSQAGGHTWKMAYEYHGATEDNVAGCVACHGDIEDFDVNGAESEIIALGDQLKTLLVDKGYLSDSGSSVSGATMTQTEAGALYNYRYIILEDGSNGIHNPRYAKALLQNSIEALQ